jgi:hypothetical protein
MQLANNHLYFLLNERLIPCDTALVLDDEGAECAPIVNLDALHHQVVTILFGARCRFPTTDNRVGLRAFANLRATVRAASRFK